MYSRRSKMNKKKSKPAKPGSNWGPRLALIEREKAQAGQILDEDEEEIYEIRHELVVPNSKKTSRTATGGGDGTAHGGRNAQSSVDPVLRLGRSSSPNYFYYNYSRRTAPNANASQRKTSCPEPGQKVKAGRDQNGHPYNHQQQQNHRRASYVLGSSSGYCSGSVTTLSGCPNNDASNLTKPLTLIIPPQDVHGREYGDRDYNGNGILMKQKNGRARHLHDHHHQNDYSNDFGTEESLDSFPSSSAYQSSGDEEIGRGNHGVVVHVHQMDGRPLKNPMAQLNSKKGGKSGALQTVKKEVVQVHTVPLDDMGNGSEPETMEMGVNGELIDDKDDKIGSTLAALHKGITMVYVPMKETGQGSNEEVSSEDIPELGDQHQMSDNDSSGSSYRGGAASKEPEDSLVSSNFILKKKTDVGQCANGPNGAMDSLLDDFDSIMFKPKFGESVHKSQERLIGTSNDCPQKGIRKRPEDPPPLPPPDQVDGQQKQQNLKQKNLRFALENLETVLNPSLKTPSPSCSSGEEGFRSNPPPPPKKVLKKVTLSLPGADAVSSKNHELFLNYEELNTCSSEILSCGHVRNDDYSTISSMTSSAQEISDLEEVINGCSGSGHSALDEHSSHEGRQSNSGSESDAGSSKMTATKEAPIQPQREPRSVLQQLRDLSRLIRGNSPTKPTAQTVKKDSQSFFLHENGNKKDTSAVANNGGGDSEVAKRKTSDATDHSGDSGKGSASGTSASGSSGQEGSSESSAEPSPITTNRATPGQSVNKGKAPTTGSGPVLKTTKIIQQAKENRRLKVATIRGRGGGTRNYCPMEDAAAGGHSHGWDPDSCSQRSSACSCQDCCDYRSDCTECVMYSKPPNSKELCNSGETMIIPARIKRKQQCHPTAELLPPPPPPPSQQRAPKQSGSRLLVRRTSSRVRAAARRTASLRRQKHQREMQVIGSQRKPVILDYCDCSNCEMHEHYQDDEFDDVDYDEEYDEGCCPDKNCKRSSPPRYTHTDPVVIPVNSSKSSGAKCKSRPSEPRKISSSSGVSSASSHGSGSQLLRNSDAAATGAALANQSTVHPIGPATSTSNLFTIDEANEDSVYGDSAGGVTSNGGSVAVGKGRRQSRVETGSGSVSSSSGGSSKSGPRVDFHYDETSDEHNLRMMNGPNKRMSSHSHHSHPKCWLAPDATLGWSDLESLYSQNMKLDCTSGGNSYKHKRGSAPPKKGYPLPAALRDECPTCWKELSEMKKNCPDPNRTVDRTKRMFIWLNRRHKEFHAPWWEAKKQASMRWLVTKSFAHSTPKDKIPDPFKESKKGKPTKYSLRDEIVKGLVSGRLYCMALDSLYRSQQNNYHLNQNLTHWEIIKILSRRGIYIAQPSDMKLTEATLRQKKPIRTAAHIALIEAMMGLYAKEILGRDRIAQTLRSFGRSIDPDTNSPERLVISWINTAVTTLKSYILSNTPQHLPPNKITRWINLPDVGEIRDLCDGVGICALFALYCSNDMKIDEISVPEPGDTLTIYDSITNHSLVQKLCEDLFPEPIYHLCVTDFLYIHGCMKQNILCFLVDLFVHLEISPIHRVNRLTHVPIRVEL